ncbi:MAG: YbhB/YbcL family Raf kinase inhibitor-like protein [Deltaproteobacteria bacterium]|nr:YbhB/YbcL family Raf kinase inhibitor-like protein [Deltaproteobacteria bacterium]
MMRISPRRSFWTIAGVIVGAGACSSASSPASDAGTSALTVTSSSFTNNSAIPAKHATTNVDGGQNKSIPLAWSGAPGTTQTFAVATIDTSALNFIHWIVVNVPATTLSLAEGASDAGITGATQLTNDFMTSGYGGMEPPQGENHTYVTTVYALNSSLSLSGTVPYATFQSTIASKIVGQGSITGTFSR